MNAGGTFDLDGHSDTVGSLILTGASIDPGDGTLTLDGNLTTDASSATTTIDGVLNLAGASSTFTIAQGTVPAGGPDVQVYADLSTSGNLIKQGPGELELMTAATATMTVSLGTLWLDGDDGSIVGALIVVGGSGPATVLDGGVASLDSGSAPVTVDPRGTFEVTGNGETIGALDLDGGAVTITAGAALTVAGGITTTAATTTATISGILDLAGSTTPTITVAPGSVTGAGPDLTISGLISGTQGFTKTGPGMLLDDAGGAYTGTTTVSQGTLLLDKTDGGAIPGNLVVGDGTDAADVREEAADQLGHENETVTVNAAGVFNLGGFNDAIGSLVLAGGTVQTGSGTLTVIGTVSTQASSTTAVISGQLALPLFAPSIDVAAGIVPDGGPDLDISAAISGGGLTMTGDGTLRLDGDNSFSGPTAIEAGVVVVTGNEALASSGVTIDTGAQLDFSGGPNGLTLSNAFSLAGSGVSGAGAIDDVNAGSTVTGPITLTANAAVGSTTGALVLSGAIGDGGGGFGLTIVGAGSVTFAGPSSNTYTGPTTVSGSLALEKSRGAVAIAGSLVVGPGGTAAERAGDQIDSGAAAVTVEAGGLFTLNALSDTIGSLTLQGGTVGAVGGLLTLDGDVTSEASATQAVLGGNVDLAGASPTFTVAAGSVPNSGADLAVTASLTGSNGLTVTGGGTIAFESKNTYAGTTTVSDGTLILQATTGPAVPGNLVIGDGTDPAEVAADSLAALTGSVTVNAAAAFELQSGEVIAALTLDGGAVATGSSALTVTGTITTIAASTTAVISGHLDVAGAAPTLTVASGTVPDGGPDLDISAVLAGTNGLTVNGGTIELDGAGTLIGTLAIDSGVVVMTNGNALGSTTVVIANGAELDVDGGQGALTVPNPMAIEGTGDPGTGAIASIGGDSTLTGSITLTGNAMVGTGSGGLTLAGAIGDGGNGYGLTELGTAPLVLDGTSSNTYGGVTTVSGVLELGKSAGAVAVAGGLAIDPGATAEELAGNQIRGNGSAVTIGLGGTFNLNGNSDTIGSLTLVGGSVTTGSGTLNLDGSLATQPAATTATISGHLDLAGSAPTIIVAQGTVPNGGPDLSISAIIAGQNGLTKLGPGTVALDATETFTGVTTVAAGLLQVGGDLSSSGAVEVAAGGAVGGSGTLGKVVVAGGTLAGASVPDVLTTDGLALGVDTAMSVRIDGDTPGGASGYDQVVSSGAVSLAGATLSVTLGNGYVPSPGALFAIIHNNSGQAVNGAFAGLPQGAVVTVGTTPFVISYQGGSFSRDVVLTAAVLTTTELATSAPSAAYGQPLTLTATVSAGQSGDTIAGTVAFYDGNPAQGGTLLGSAAVNAQGIATLATTAMHVVSAGHQVYAVFNPSTWTFEASSTSAPVGQSITPAVLKIQANNLSMVYGGTVPALSDTTSGFLNGDTLASLAAMPTLATPVTSAAAAGTYPIVVSTAASADYAMNFVPGTLTIVPASTTTSWINTGGSSTYGETVTFTVQVSPTTTVPAPVTGTVTWYVDGNPVGASRIDPATGRATYSTATLGVGAYYIGGSYGGALDFSASQATITAEGVVAATTVTTVTAAAIVNGRGRVAAVQLTAYVGVAMTGDDTAIGIVTFQRNRTPIARVRFTNGTATIVIRSSRAVNQSFNALYGGPSGFGTSGSRAMLIPKAGLPTVARFAHRPKGLSG